MGKFGIFYTGSQDVCSRCLKQRDLMFLMRPRSSPAVFVVTKAGVSFKETLGQMHTYIYWCHVGFEWHCSHRDEPNQSSSSDSWEKRHTHKTGVLCSSLLLLLLIIVTLIKQGTAASVTTRIRSAWDAAAVFPFNNHPEKLNLPSAQQELCYITIPAASCCVSRIYGRLSSSISVQSAERPSRSQSASSSD